MAMCGSSKVEGYYDEPLVLKFLF